ncbi:hypothetical protein ACWDXT_12125 [Streptomyces sp. NPDC003236]
MTKAASSGMRPSCRTTRQVASARPPQRRSRLTITRPEPNDDDRDQELVTDAHE